ncbi:urease accessory protein UreD [Streptomyces sp. SL13]|uniref:Urease accessory protein UreD n=1 Tax=Streptantibioticus silvisoli TaxID=2705255 RepID=A0AA90HAT1_9ACTN|nr:urease accessory protein UreD [Streptantibioticus silvisoli]MDI5973399.1 urease accessory protein UreD [Streptantibioticus silvisoli]
MTAPPAVRGVRAAARIAAVPDGRGGTALPLLAGDGPLALRRTRSAPGWARVTVVGAMCAPLGGDRLALDAEVAAGARLLVGSAAATVALPGADGARATYDTNLTVGRNAELHWEPEPLIAAAGSDLAVTTRIRLTAGARLVLREIQVLGRAGEAPGHLTSRLTATLDGQPLLEQELALGPGEPGWDGPAVLGGHRAVGQLLLVAPEFTDAPPNVTRLSADRGDGVALVTPLAGPAVLVTALAADGLTVRHLLDRARPPLPGAA